MNNLYMDRCISMKKWHLFCSCQTITLETAQVSKIYDDDDDDDEVKT